MKKLGVLAVTITLLQTATTAQSAKQTDATDLTNADVQARVKEALKTRTSDTILRLVDTGKYNVGIALVRRAEGEDFGNALNHEQITEVYMILRGSGTQITGGALVDAKKQSPVRPAIGPSWAGSNVKNGRSTKLGPGDIQIIPPGVPHVWSSIDAGGIDYLVFRVDPEHVLVK